MNSGTVALVGRPNAGKSTLLNRILGRKVAIVSDKPQTTRVSILGVKTTDRGQIVFIDNPGIHKPLHGLNRRMMNFVFTSLETADLVSLLVDASEPFGHGDAFVLETLKDVTKPTFLLLNKVDLIRKDRLLPLIDRYKDLHSFREIIPVSALKGVNLDRYEDCLYKALPERDRVYGPGEITDRPREFFLAETIREKLLDRVSQELPFVTAVLVERIEERTAAPAEAGGGAKGPVTYIKASILVEKDSHRKIVIGRQARMLKAVGSEARREIEGFLKTRVFLDIQVKVRARWRDAADVLDLIEGRATDVEPE
jgi:GTP-binding protein Era